MKKNHFAARVARLFAGWFAGFFRRADYCQPQMHDQEHDQHNQHNQPVGMYTIAYRWW